jgi:hypothetical protein
MGAILDHPSDNARQHGQPGVSGKSFVGKVRALMIDRGGPWDAYVARPWNELVGQVANRLGGELD